MDDITAENATSRICFPLPSSMNAVKNLVYTIYSKGYLLNKTTGSDFYISDVMLEEVKQAESLEDLLSLLCSAGNEGLRGLDFSDEFVTFTGFKTITNTNNILAAAIYNYCFTNHHVQAKRADINNEKFSFRIWLVQLGLKGLEFKAARKELYSHLTGHTAFRTEKDKERWNARRKARKEFMMRNS